MHTVDFVMLGIVAACCAVCFIPATSCSVRRLALILILAAGLFGLFGVFLIHRLAWYTPQGEKHISYSEADKEKFAEGAAAAGDTATRFLPLIFSSLVVLTVVAIRRV